MTSAFENPTPSTLTRHPGPPALPIRKESVVKTEVTFSLAPPAMTRIPEPPALPVPKELIVETERAFSPASPALTRIPAPRPYLNVEERW